MREIHRGMASKSLCPWDSPDMNTGVGLDMNTGAGLDMNTGAGLDMNTGVGCRALLLHGIFPTRGSNPSLMSPALAAGF